MDTILTIDCAAFSTREEMHHALARALCFPAHCGCNLDALHDCLTEISRETKLRLLHWEAAEALLGPRAKVAILSAALDNPSLSVIFD